MLAEGAVHRVIGAARLSGQIEIEPHNYPLLDFVLSRAMNFSDAEFMQ